MGGDCRSVIPGLGQGVIVEGRPHRADQREDHECVGKHEQGNKDKRCVADDQAGEANAAACITRALDLAQTHVAKDDARDGGNEREEDGEEGKRVRATQRCHLRRLYGLRGALCVLLRLLCLLLRVHGLLRCLLLVGGLLCLLLRLLLSLLRLLCLLLSLLSLCVLLLSLLSLLRLQRLLLGLGLLLRLLLRVRLGFGGVRR